MSACNPLEFVREPDARRRLTTARIMKQTFYCIELRSREHFRTISFFFFRRSVENELTVTMMDEAADPNPSVPAANDPSVRWSREGDKRAYNSLARGKPLSSFERHREPPA